MIKNRKDFKNFIKDFPHIIDNKYKESFSKDGFLYSTSGKIMAKIKTDLLDGIYDNKTGELLYKKESNFTPVMAKEIIPEHEYLNLSFHIDKEKIISAIETGTKKEIGQIKFETSQVKFEIINNYFNINGIRLCDASYSRDTTLNFTKDHFKLMSYLGNTLTIKVYDNYDLFILSESKIITHRPIIIEDEDSNQLVVLPLSY